jgi:hypothetical protein
MVQLNSKAAIAVIGMLLAAPGQAFVLLSGPTEAKLPVTPESPAATFIYQLPAPNLTDKDKFLDGQFAGLSDDELFPILVRLAMKQWNDVTGSFVKLTLEEGGNPDFTGDDLVNSIVFGNANLSTAALAYPTIESAVIVDCDIKVSNRSVSTTDMAYTLLHELGHCLGLGHYHTNYQSVMGYSHGSTSLKLAPDDKAGIIFLYPDPALSDGKVHELVNCGTIAPNGGQNRHRHGDGFSLVLLPIALIIVLTIKARLAQVLHKFARW